MTAIQFDGQQTDERILFMITPHRFAHYIAITKLFFLCAVFYSILIFISYTVPVMQTTIRGGGFVLAVLTFLAGFWWNKRVYTLSKTYITDRRIIRFEI